MRVKVRLQKLKTSPQRAIVSAFAAAIVFGTLLLILPFANADGHWGSTVNAFFLATSATCVTGLDTIGIGQSLSTFGLCVIVALVELGGVGVMTIGTIFFIAMGKRLTRVGEQALMSSLGVDAVADVGRILRNTLLFTLSWEAIGTLVIATKLVHAFGYPWQTAIPHSFFMSVMAFCNAGFTIDPNSMRLFSEDPYMLSTLIALMLVGGIGFIVHANILQHFLAPRKHRKRPRLSLHTTLVLKTTAFILTAGTIAFILLERSASFASLSAGDTFINALFQTVTSRTTGFSSIPTYSLRNASIMTTMLIMFVGAAPGSTGGGIKVTTAAVLFLAVRDIILKKERVETHSRSIPARIVTEAISITVLSIVAILAALLVVSITEEQSGTSLFSLFFEVVSAYTTTGLSLGATPSLNDWSKLLLVACMFIGRLGPMTLAVTLSNAKAGPSSRYPEENIIVG